MRITQSMLASSTLRHLSSSYQELGRIQDQLSTGKKINRASQDPVVAMNGMRYRTQVTEVEQFKRNLSEVYNWMDTADASLDEGTQTLHRIRELTVQASNDTYEETQRANIAKEITQLREHLVALGNTRSNNKYIFNGTNTTTQPINTEKMDVKADDATFLAELAAADFTDPTYSMPYEVTYDGELYELQTVDDPEDPAATPAQIEAFQSSTGKIIKISPDGSTITHYKEEKDENGVDQLVTNTLNADDIVISHRDAVSTNNQDVEIEVLKGVNIAVNINPSNVFSNDLFGDLIRLENTLKDTSTKAGDITGFLNNIDAQIDSVVNERAELGARYNRVEMVEGRVMEQEVIAKRIMSNNENADMEKVIIDLKSQESVHRAALSAGSKIIQPTLMDFLR